MVNPLAAMVSSLLALAAPDDGLSPVPCAFTPAYFEPGSAILTEPAVRLFIAGYLTYFEVLTNSGAEISLAGIAVDGGSEANDRLLVERREQAVRDLLVARGMSPTRITIGPRERLLAGLPLSSTDGRAVVVEVRIPPADLARLMPAGGPIC